MVRFSRRAASCWSLLGLAVTSALAGCGSTKASSGEPGITGASGTSSTSGGTPSGVSGAATTGSGATGSGGTGSEISSGTAGSQTGSEMTGYAATGSATAGATGTSGAGGESGAGGVDAGAGADATVDSGAILLDAGTSGPPIDSGWPTCTDEMAVDPNPNDSKGLLIPNNLAPLNVKRTPTGTIVKIRDTYIAPAPNETTPDGLYYLTGTTADNPDAWSSYDGIELWSSPDLKTWTYLGFIWTFSVDAKAEPNAWFAQPIMYTSPSHNGGKAYPLQVIWAPEIHYIRGNWYIPFSMPGAATGILKSTTGKPTGPYRNDIPNDGYIAKSNIDPDLFQDTDGTVYYVDHKGNMAPMNSDLTGLASPLVLQVATAGGNPNNNVSNPGEGAFMFRAFNQYYLDVTLLNNSTVTLEILNRYSSWIATTTASPLAGPYTKLYEAVPYAGHNDYFKDKKCRWWSTLFGNHQSDPIPVFNQPAIVPVEFGSDHLIRVDFDPRP